MLEGFSIDKRIPLALIMAILVQTATVAWWGAHMEARVDALEQLKDPSVAPRMAVIESKMDVAMANFNRNFEILQAIDTKLRDDASRSRN
jgi:hypothetical protein